MSIQAPQGILNIPNAILRVGKLAVDEVVGADTILNTVARNTILLVDGEEYTENKNWSLKLPNAWAGEFDIKTTGAGNYAEFNFYNEGASSNAQGYNLTFNDTAVELRYDGGSAIATGTLNSTVVNTYRKVRLMFERTILSVTVDGTLIFTHDDTGGPRPRVYSTTAGGFLNFFTDGGAIDNLKIVNEKWMSDGTSNIAYVGGGEVAVGQSLNLQQVSNTASIKLNSNVVTEFPRSKKLIKYPRVALPSNQTSNPYTYGDYTIEVSSFYDDNASLAGSNAFDNIHNNYGWISDLNTYDGSTGTATTATNADTFQSIAGSWIGIQLPDKIRLEYITIKNRINATIRNAVSGILWAKNTTNTTWYRIHDFSGLNTNNAINTIYVNQTIAYDEYRLQITEMVPYSSGGEPAVAISEWELYGTPEYDPDADGTDVVVKSVPNVPNTDWLEVYYDAKDLVDGSTTVNDLKPVGTAVNGVVNGNTSVTDGAFTFDGTGDYILGQLTSFGGEQTFTFSLWFNMLEFVSGSNNSIFQIGSQGSSEEGLGFRVQSGSVFRMYTWGGPSNFNVGTVLPKTWYHAVGTYAGGVMTLYVDGNILQSTSGSSLNLPTDPYFALGVQLTSSGTEYSTSGFNGSIANFRLFNRALTSDEIWQLYAYQKEYFGHGDLSMTLKAGRLGIGTSEPRAMLDVRGAIRASDVPVFSARNVVVGIYAWDTAYNDTAINFTTVDVNHNNCYDGTSAFTAPRDGIYSFTVIKNLNMLSNYQLLRAPWVNFLKNGSTHQSTTLLSTSTGVGINNTTYAHTSGTASRIMSLAAGDRVQVAFHYNNSPSTQYEYGIDYFSGYLITYT